MKKKSDIILIVVTVILVIVLGVGFIYDRNEFLLERTNKFVVAGDENLKVIKMNKVGFLYARAAYEAKLQVLDGSWGDYVIKISNIYGGEGQMFDYAQYKQFEADTMDAVTIKPDPREDSFIWVLGVPLKENSSENIVYVMTMEGEDHKVFIYMYYSRK